MTTTQAAMFDDVSPIDGSVVERFPAMTPQRSEERRVGKECPV